MEALAVVMAREVVAMVTEAMGMEEVAKGAARGRGRAVVRATRMVVVPVRRRAAVMVMLMAVMVMGRTVDAEGCGAH